MAYCKTKYEISTQKAEPSWVKLQIEAHESGCTLCYLIDEAAQNGGVLPLAIADQLRLPVIEKSGDAWIGANSQSVVVYNGQQLLVG